MELRPQGPEAEIEPRRCPYVLLVGQPVTTLLGWGRVKGLMWPFSYHGEQGPHAQTPRHHSLPQDKLPPSGSHPCQPASDVCKYLLVVFALHARR